MFFVNFPLKVVTSFHDPKCLKFCVHRDFISFFFKSFNLNLIGSPVVDQIYHNFLLFVFFFSIVCEYGWWNFGVKVLTQFVTFCYRGCTYRLSLNKNVHSTLTDWLELEEAEQKQSCK